MRTIPIAILYVTEGCNLQCLMCSYRQPKPNELSVDEIKDLAKQLHQFGLQHIVYSGGEPLLRRDFDQICEIFTERNIKQTLLTNGLLLDRRSSLLRHFTEVIVSVDGSTSEIHDSIRGVRSFDQIVRGLRNVVQMPNRPAISIRSVIQKRNYRQLPALVTLAGSLGIDRISFLAADMISGAFARGNESLPQNKKEILLDDLEIQEYRTIIDKMAATFKDEFANAFISESPQKLHHIANYFEAVLNKAPFPQNQCNAPMVSAVITSTGEVNPCFFLPTFGHVRRGSIADLVNSEMVRLIRSEVRLMQLDRCKTCVCTLYKDPIHALLNRF
jgi:MoaA/NifB/PqqE/SkfB family radical SAM enzyme